MFHAAKDHYCLLSLAGLSTIVFAENTANRVVMAAARHAVTSPACPGFARH